MDATMSLLSSVFNPSAWAGPFTYPQVILISIFTSAMVHYTLSPSINKNASALKKVVLNASRYNLSTNYKMVLVIRTDIPMTSGKVAAQCCHACLLAYQEALATCPDIVKHWERYGQAKITLKCQSEDELLLLQGIAQSKSLPSQSICDAGRTQIAAGTRTVLAIGPGPVDLVNQVTGHLKLY